MAVEVTIRFAGELVEVVRVPRGRSFRIGTAPDVDAVVPGLASFPLVDTDGNVRMPVGELGVEITVAPAAPTTPIPFAKLSRRLLPYLAGVLVVHLVVWAAAMTRELPTPPEKPRLARIAMHREPPPPPVPREREHEHEHAGASAHADASPSYIETLRAQLPRLPHIKGNVGFMSGAQFEAIAGTVDLTRYFADLKGPIYLDNEPPAFGGRGDRFQPPPGKIIPAGRYATVAHGRGAGEQYHLAGEAELQVELCASKACTASGAIDRASVTSWIAPHADDFRVCYDGSPSTLVDFTIADGVVHNARGRGAAGKCAAGLISAIAFPHVDGATRVRYEIAFHG